MAKEIKTEILINASPERVWEVLTKFQDYPYWNPFITSLTGEVKTGKKIKATIAPPDANAMVFKLKVLAFEKNKEFRWLGHLIIPGLFDGEHKFELVDKGNGTTTFRHSETFKGLLIPLFKKMLDNNTLRGFEMMNQSLKQEVENNSIHI